MFEDVVVFNREVYSVELLLDFLNQVICIVYSKKGVVVLSVFDDLFVEKIKCEFVYILLVYIEGNFELKKEQFVICV